MSKENYFVEEISVDAENMSNVTDEHLLENLKKYFKHNGFKSEQQKNAIKNILQSKFLGAQISQIYTTNENRSR